MYACCEHCSHPGDMPPDLHQLRCPLGCNGQPRRRVTDWWVFRRALGAIRRARPDWYGL